MDFDVYCDEALPELFTTHKSTKAYLMIGSLWLPSELRDHAKIRIKELRKKHGVYGEMKWTKISPSKQAFYEDLIDLFLEYGKQMRFRCIAVDRNNIDWDLHDGDGELGFYKFYYQMLHHWVLDFNDYRIFCDTKTNRDLSRLRTLRRCLGDANKTSTISNIQALPSRQLVLIQLCDVLLGAASSRLNRTLREEGAKFAVVQRLEAGLKVTKLAPTFRGEEKYDIFKIQLRGGW